MSISSSLWKVFIYVILHQQWAWPQRLSNMISTFSTLVSMSYILYLPSVQFCLIYQELSHLIPWSYCNYSVISDIKMKLLNIHEGLENQIQ